MPTIAEFAVPTEAFALAETLPRFPSVAVEVDRIAAHVPDATMPSFWASNGDTPGFVEAIEADRTVEAVRARADFGPEYLFHVEWSEDIDRLVTEMIDHEGVILEASGRADEWRLRIRFMTRGQFENFQGYFEGHSPPFRLTQLFPARHPRHTRGDVTPGQHEALTRAVELGYFEVPRATSIQAVADAIGISDQAVSERLRRGTENLVRDMLLVEPIQERQ